MPGSGRTIWVKPVSGAPLNTNERQELRKKLMSYADFQGEVKMERDFIKKCATYFVKESR